MARQGYKSIAEQVEANKRYEERNPAAKERNRISRLKSSAKRFIRDYATVEDLEELKEMIANKEEKMMTVDEKIKKMVEDKGEAFVAYKVHFEISKKLKELRRQDWDKILVDTTPDETIGVFATKEEAEEAVRKTCDIRKFNNSGYSFLTWDTGIVVCAFPALLKEAEEDGVEGDIEGFLASKDEDGFIGQEDLEEFCKTW